MEMLTKKLAVLLIFLMLLGLPCVQAEETTKVLDCAAQEGSLEYLKYVPTFEEAYAAAMEKVPGNALIVDIDYRLQGLYGELHWNFTIIYQDVETLQLQQLNVSVYGYDIGVEVGTSTSPFEQPKNWEFSYIREMTRKWENAYGARMFWTPEMKADFAARYGWYRRASVDYESMPYMPEESNLTLEEARAAADKTLFDTYGVHIDDLSMREDSRYLKDARGIGYWQFSYWGKIKIGEQEYLVEIFEISQNTVDFSADGTTLIPQKDGVFVVLSDQLAQAIFNDLLR